MKTERSCRRFNNKIKRPQESTFDYSTKYDRKTVRRSSQSYRQTPFRSAATLSPTLPGNLLTSKGPPCGHLVHP